MATEFNFPGFYQGDKLDFSLTALNDDDTQLFLTGFTAQIDIKEFYHDDDSEPLLTLSSSGGSINIIENFINVFLPTSGMTLENGNYKYDVELTDASGNTQTLIFGNFPVVKERTV